MRRWLVVKVSVSLLIVVVSALATILLLHRFTYKAQVQAIVSQIKRTNVPDVPFTLFLSPDSLPGDVSLSISTTEPNISSLSFAVGVKFGMGVTKNTYLYVVFPVSSQAYDPPKNCGLPRMYLTDTNPRACEKYESAKPDLPAYCYYGQLSGGAIQNTSVKQYVTMYAQRQNSVIAVTSADTDCVDLYARIKGLKELNVDDIPTNKIIVDGKYIK